jgi:hypothetical protein
MLTRLMTLGVNRYLHPEVRHRLPLFVVVKLRDPLRQSRDGIDGRVHAPRPRGWHVFTNYGRVPVVLDVAPHGLVPTSPVRGFSLFDLTDVLLAAVLILLNGFISGAGQDLWLWLRDRIRRRQE